MMILHGQRFVDFQAEGVRRRVAWSRNGEFRSKANANSTCSESRLPLSRSKGLVQLPARCSSDLLLVTCLASSVSTRDRETGRSLGEHCLGGVPLANDKFPSPPISRYSPSTSSLIALPPLVHAPDDGHQSTLRSPVSFVRPCASLRRPVSAHLVCRLLRHNERECYSTL